MQFMSVCDPRAFTFPGRSPFIALLVSVFLVPIARTSSSADDLKATRAELKARLHQAVDAEDWPAVDNLKTAIQNLDSAFSKRPSNVVNKRTPSSSDRESVAKKLSDAGIHLQLSPSDDGPAQFAFSRDIEAGTRTVFTANFFLFWSTTDAIADRFGWRHDSWDMDASLSTQGKLSSANDTNTDAWRYRATLNGRYTANATSTNPDSIVGLTWDASFEDEASRDFDYNRISGEVNLTPTIPLLAMGVYKPDPSDKPSPFRFRWRPYFGLNAGSVTSDRRNAAEGADDTLWLVGKLVAKLQLDFIARALNFSEVSLFAEDHITDLSESDTWHNYFIGGLNLMMSDNFGFSLSYTIGEDSPKFMKEEVFKGAFGVKF
jgi:hypothetical protein